MSGEGEQGGVGLQVLEADRQSPVVQEQAGNLPGSQVQHEHGRWNFPAVCQQGRTRGCWKIHVLSRREIRNIMLSDS